MKMFILGLMFLTGLYRVESGYYCKQVHMSKTYIYARTSMTKWFKQVLDHSDRSDTKFWNQRYHERSTYWKNPKKGPIFLMLTGEYEASKYLLEYGFWIQLAEEFGALRFILEHRYYGLSRPTEDTSIENLKYLTIRNVIGDVTNFIKSMRREYNLTSDNKWVLFGGGYGGNIAAWSQAKLRKLVFGSVVSSAPLQATVDFSDYQSYVRNILDYYSPNCTTPIFQAVKGIKNKFRSPKGTKEMTEKFKVCDGEMDSGNPKDVSLFFLKLFKSINNAAEYDTGLPYLEDTNTVCNFMNKADSSDPVERLVALNNYFTYLKRLNHQDAGCLLANYTTQIELFKKTGWNDTNVQNGKRQWLYQRCNELGYFQTSNAPDSLLKGILPLQFFTDACQDVFGSSFDEAHVQNGVRKTNEIYQGIKAKNRFTIFVKNDLDPWETLGMQKKPTANSHLIEVEESSHCRDMKDTQNAYDGDSLIYARKEITRIIQTLWKFSGK